MFFGKPKWDPRGTHCIVTGGSSGLGLELSKILVSRGAHVTIIARNQVKLDEALESIKSSASSPLLKINAVSADLSLAEGAREGIRKAVVPFGGKMADTVFMCAGMSLPGFFIEQDDAILTQVMNADYWTACWTAKASARLMAKQHERFPSDARPKLVFVGSTLSFLNFAGYACYCPPKAAIRSLADTLRNELQLFGIGVHCFFPGGILSPGFETENIDKPQLTKDIEGSDVPLDPKLVATYLLKGIARNEYSISYDFVTGLLRSSARGITPYNHNFLKDVGFSFLGMLFGPVWRRWSDYTVREARPAVLQRLKEEGFFEEDK
ncbi:hypothetical protein BDY24DRAFT_364205 [Mrakia frigida]|uniref:3-dehydrosphinganine reductase n=1 Tax=Mrakia frigida TaxID=29902 RepID=UPI003FCC1AC8